jgi:hypothetical protein
MRSSVRATRFTEATTVLQRIADEEKLEAFNTTEEGVPPPYPLITAYPAGSIPSNFKEYRYQIDVISSDPGGKWVQKRITVFWPMGYKTAAADLMRISTDIICLY